MHRTLDRYATLCCPVSEVFGQSYHWSLMQVEYAPDLAFEGTCIKHRFGKCSIKMYDKHGIVLRIETTSNDVSFFKHQRKVEHRQGPSTRELASVKKSIYSLIYLREILRGCNRRYIATTSPPGFGRSTV